MFRSVGPALACRLLDTRAEELLSGHPAAEFDLPRTGPLLGALFESLVTLDVRVYAQAAEGRVGHLRTWNDDREVDLIAQKGRRLLAIEVKLTTTPDRRDTRHLRWLADKMGPDLADSMVVTTGRHAYRDRDGIAIVPGGRGARVADCRSTVRRRRWLLGHDLLTCVYVI